MGGSLEIGLVKPLDVRREFLHSTDARSNQHLCRVLYVSDIHLRPRRSGVLREQVLKSAEASRADLILLGGDLLDRRSELPELTLLVAELRRLATVLAVGGNHDAAVGLPLVRDAVIQGGAEWIHDRSVAIRFGSRTIAVSGPDAREHAAGDVRILCAHNPRIWRTVPRQSFDLVLAGHLHGCQLVAFEYRDRLFPGAWFYPCCYLSHRRDRTMLVVSRGVSDLFPIRWRCPREVVLCHV